MITQNYVMGCIIIVIYSTHIQASVRRTAEEGVSNYNCFRLNSCDSHGQPVCGYDEEDATIAKFENECALFKVNCEERGQKLFKIVDDSICEKKVVPVTTIPTTITSPTIDYYYDLRPDTEPDSSTHYWQDSLMLGQRVTPGYNEEGRVLREETEKYYFPDLMTLVMRY
ncbi:uncharacterized protein LOC134746944 [Cydia strobilella]|uniref:uncharacterized protein LOC134746944 n=1 Tax=Cydia strobilella TaxID=1100964 RepID=UPI0030054785